MAKLTYRASYYVLYAIFAAIIIVLCLFFFGGEMEIPLVPEMSNPAHTDSLLFLMYGLLGLTVLVTALAFIVQFATLLKDSPATALKSLVGLLLLIGLLVVTWTLGSSEPLEIQGYEGTSNRDPFWLKTTDMFIFSLYFLVGANIVAMLFSGIKKKLL